MLVFLPGTSIAARLQADVCLWGFRYHAKLGMKRFSGRFSPKSGAGIRESNPMSLRIAYRRVVWISTGGLFTKFLGRSLCGLPVPSPASTFVAA